MNKDMITRLYRPVDSPLNPVLHARLNYYKKVPYQSAPTAFQTTAERRGPGLVNTASSLHSTSPQLNPLDTNIPLPQNLPLPLRLLLLPKQLLPILLPVPIHQPRKPLATFDPPFDSAFQHEHLHVVVAGDFAHVLEEPGGAAGAAAAGGAWGISK